MGGCQNDSGLWEESEWHMSHSGLISVNIQESSEMSWHNDWAILLQ